MKTKACWGSAYLGIAFLVLFAYFKNAAPSPEPQTWHDIMARANELGLHCKWDGPAPSSCMAVSVTTLTKEDVDNLNVAHSSDQWSGKVKVYSSFLPTIHISHGTRWGRFVLYGDQAIIKRLTGVERLE